MTKRGQIAAYVAGCNEGWPGRLEVVQSLDDLDPDWPADIVDLARGELTGKPAVIERDI